MKATELMIGDLVIVKSKITKVEEVDFGSINTTYSYGEIEDYIDEDNILPIPLTAEILEKNGIKKRGDEYVVFGWDGAKQWSVALEDFKPHFDFWFITSSDRDLNVRGKIRFVHELQHALRLCGLNDEAENFEVE